MRGHDGAEFAGTKEERGASQNVPTLRSFSHFRGDKRSVVPAAIEPANNE